MFSADAIDIACIDNTQQTPTSRFCLDTACVDTIDAIDTALCRYNIIVLQVETLLGLGEYKALSGICHKPVLKSREEVGTTRV